MKLSDIFDQLTFGELAHVFIGGGDKKEIAPSSYREMGAHLNLALTALHTRFMLREEEILVEKQGVQSDYLLDPRFTLSNQASSEPVRYLLDSQSAPFNGNVLRITAAYNSSGIELPLNDAGQALSLYTPRHDIVQIPYGAQGDVFALLYQANHPRLTLTAATDPTQVEVDLHPSFLQALLFFVASRACISAGADAAGDESGRFLMKYETECQHLNFYNLDGDSVRTSSHLENNGWV